MSMSKRLSFCKLCLKVDILREKDIKIKNICYKEKHEYVSLADFLIDHRH